MLYMSKVPIYKYLNQIINYIKRQSSETAHRYSFKRRKCVNYVNIVEPYEIRETS